MLAESETRAAIAVGIPRPVRADEVQEDLSCRNPSSIDVEELLASVRAADAEPGLLDECALAMDRHEEGDAEEGVRRAQAAIERCPPGAALGLMPIGVFAECVACCIDSARFNAEEAVVDLTGDPFAGTLSLPFEDGRSVWARGHLVRSYGLIASVATALGGDLEQAANGMAASQELVQDESRSMLESHAGKLVALCDMAETCIDSEMSMLEDRVLLLRKMIGSLGPSGFVSAACASIVMRCGVKAQTTCLMEECAELIQAASKSLRHGDPSTRANLIEEIADVEFMVEQVKMLHGIGVGEVEVAKLGKAVRTLERLRIPFEEIALSKGEEPAVSQGGGCA